MWLLDSLNGYSLSYGIGSLIIAYLLYYGYFYIPIVGNTVPFYLFSIAGLYISYNNLLY